EVARVARVHPAVGAQVLGGCGLVPVVADEDVRVPRDDLADAVLVRLIDADLYARIERNADRVEVDLSGRMDGVGAHELRLPVELPQRDAERQEEAERIGTERGPARRGRAQAREAEAVAQRPEQQQIRSP